jgi:hypothetical protein
MKKLFVCFCLLMSASFLATNAKAQVGIPGTFRWIVDGQSFTCETSTNVCFYVILPSPRGRSETQPVELVSTTKNSNGEEVKIYRINDKSGFLPGSSTEGKGPKTNQPLGRTRED